MKRYYELTKEEKLALDSEQLTVAIKLEAIERGIKPPLTLSEHINQGLYTGYTLPADSVAFWEVCYSKEHYSSGFEPTGLAFKTREQAEKVLDGALVIERDYGRKISVHERTFVVQMVRINLGGGKTAIKKIEEFTQDDTEFTKLADEIEADLHRMRQESYNKKVNLEKKAQYLELSGGNEEIAKAFWSKTERTDWPSE